MSAFMMSSSSSVPMTRLQEKTELSILNDRYSDYIAKVRKLRQEANQDDSSALLNSIHNLEEEINAIKALYDNELEKLRRELEAVMGEKQRLELFAKKNNGLATELQDRLTVEQRQNQALIGELGNLQQLLSRKDLEINQMAGERDDLAKRLNDLQRDYDGLLRDFEEVSRKLEKETVEKNVALNALDNLQQKLDFHMQVNAEEVAELKSRLEDKAKQILMLEGKVRELGRSDNSLHELLARVRETANAELQKYKDESEAQYAKNLHELQLQMEQDASNIARLADENKQLCAEIDDYRREIHTLQNKVRTLDHNNGDLAESLDQERQKSSVHIQSLEAKLKEIQDMLIYKLQELGSGKEPPIRVEIEALKALVEEEENRLQNVERAHTTVPPIHTSGLMTSLTAHNKLPPGSRLVKCGSSWSSPAYTGKYANLTGLSTSVTTRGGFSRPTRPASVPAPVTMGQGKDYFDSMFGDFKKDMLHYPRLHPKSSPPSFTPSTHDYNTSTSSFTGTIKILEINPDGRFVRLFNSSPNQDMEFGGFMIQQNVGGHPVAVYRFPPRTRFRAGSTITVWASSGQGKHKPPTDFLWKEQHKWGVGPECTTILCKPTGQAIAWTTAAHRFTKNAISFDALSDNSSDADKGESNPSPEFTVEVDGKPVAALKVEKEEPPLLSPAKHPHGLFTGDDPHPSVGAARVKSGGNDNSSYCRQTRSQNSNPVPDRMPHPGDLYAGAGAGGTRLGSAPLRTSSAKKANNGSTNMQLSPFMSPHQQKYSTVNKISSQHRVTFQPPMPRPPVVSSW